MVSELSGGPLGPTSSGPQAVPSPCRSETGARGSSVCSTLACRDHLHRPQPHPPQPKRTRPGPRYWLTVPLSARRLGRNSLDATRSPDMSRYRCAVSPVPAISRASRACASRRARGQGGRTLRLRTTLPPGSGLEEKLRLRTSRGPGAGACVGAPRLRTEDSWTLLYSSSSFGAPG